jgi:hypothetical protein
VHPLEGSRVKEPVDKLGSTHAKWMLKILPGTRAETIDGNRKRMSSQL